MQYIVNQLIENYASVTETLLQSLNLFRKDSNIHNLKSFFVPNKFRAINCHHFAGKMRAR